MEIKRFSMEGSSLIEVMISLFVFAIGILGVLSMQAQSVKLNNNAFLYSQANVLAMEIVEQMRASPTMAEDLALGNCAAGTLDECCGPRDDGNDEPEEGDPVPSSWTEIISQKLPGGRGNVIDRDAANGVIEVVVCFDSGVNEATQQFVVGGVNLITVL